MISFTRAAAHGENQLFEVIYYNERRATRRGGEKVIRPRRPAAAAAGLFVECSENPGRFA